MSQPLALRCAAYVQQMMPTAPVFLLLEGATDGAASVSNMTGGKANIHAHTSLHDMFASAAGAVCSVGKHGLEVEVGPTPQGVLRDETIQLMETAVLLCLDYLSACSNGTPLTVPSTITVYQDEGDPDPRNPNPNVSPQPNPNPRKIPLGSGRNWLPNRMYSQ